MCVDVGHLYIHAKFCDPEGLRIAYMLKKPKFWLFLAFFGIFMLLQKSVSEILAQGRLWYLKTTKRGNAQKGR